MKAYERDVEQIASCCCEGDVRGNSLHASLEKTRNNLDEQRKKDKIRYRVYSPARASWASLSSLSVADRHESLWAETGRCIKAAHISRTDRETKGAESEVDLAVRKQRRWCDDSKRGATEAHRFCDFALPPPLFPSLRRCYNFPGRGVMDEAVSAHVHYNAYHLFFPARLSALQEMPERYGIHEERANAHLILWREFA